MIKYADAVKQLVEGNYYGPVNGPINDYVFQDNQTPPSEEQIQAKLAELQAEYDSKSYARARASQYPSIQDQLDMQYHDLVDGTTTWKDAIAKVKSDNPKP